MPRIIQNMESGHASKSNQGSNPIISSQFTVVPFFQEWGTVPVPHLAVLVLYACY